MPAMLNLKAAHSQFTKTSSENNNKIAFTGNCLKCKNLSYTRETLPHRELGFQENDRY